MYLAAFVGFQGEVQSTLLITSPWNPTNAAYIEDVGIGNLHYDACARDMSTFCYLLIKFDSIEHGNLLC